MTVSFAEVPLDALQEKPKPKQPSARQLRIQREIEAVQETIKNAKSAKKERRGGRRRASER